MKDHAILSGFIRALNHRLRTPLSVVSNDLEALRAQLPSEEYERMRRKISQISELLRSVQRFSGALTLDSSVDLAQLVRSVAEERAVGAVLGNIDPARVQGSESLVRVALDGVLELLQSLPGAALLSIKVLRDADAARLTISFEATAGTVMQSAPSSYDGLTEYFNETLDLDALSPPCIDSILAAHRATVSVTSGDTLRVLISLPCLP